MVTPIVVAPATGSGALPSSETLTRPPTPVDPPAPDAGAGVVLGGRDLVEPLRPALSPLDAMRRGHDANIDPLVRGTRAVDGSAVQAALLGEAGHDGAQLRVTTQAVQVSAEGAAGTHGQLSLDRQSALAGAAIPVSPAGQDVAVTAGALANMAFAGANYRDGNGNSVGGFAVLTAGGVPGLGFSYAHVGAMGGVAVSPSGIADVARSANVVRAERAASDGAGDGVRVTVQQTSNKMAVGQVVVSAGHVGAVVGRIAKEVRHSKTLTSPQTPGEAKKLMSYENFLGRRLKGLGLVKTGGSLPKMSDLDALGAGSTLLQEAQKVTAVSVGVAAAGVNAMAGVIADTTSYAEVSRSAAEPGTLEVVVGAKKARTVLGAIDLPVLGSTHVKRVEQSHRALSYKFTGDDAAAPQQVLQRPRNFFGRKAHFQLDQDFVPEQLQTPFDALQALDALQEKQPNLHGLSFESAKGGRSWQVSVLPLPANYLGPRGALSYEQERNVHVRYLDASRNVGNVVDGIQHQVQYQLPLVGLVRRKIEVLTVETTERFDAVNATGAPQFQDRRIFMLKIKDFFGHASHKTLRKMHETLSHMVPSQLQGKAPPTSHALPPVPMNLEVEVAMELTPAALRKVAAASSLLAEAGEVPSADASIAAQLNFFAKGLQAVHQIARNGSDLNALVRALDDAQAPVQIFTSTDMIRTLEHKSAAVQVKFAALPADAKPAQQKKLLAKAAKAAKRLVAAHALVQTSPLNLASSDALAEGRQNLRAQGREMARLAMQAPQETLAALLSPTSSDKERAQLQDLKAAERLTSPRLAHRDLPGATRTTKGTSQP